ncbi:MAG: hypothetical protein WCV67_08885 [Victivallaceae bacterium]
MNLALCIANRGFFPGELIALTRNELLKVIGAAGYGVIMPPVEKSKYGAVETIEEGMAYADFLRQNQGNYDGVILVLPNFGDENGAAEALRHCGVPIYILAYPDDLGKMDFSQRRDAFCGKLSIMDVFTQYGIRFTAWGPHVLKPSVPLFMEHLEQFAAVCRIVKGLKSCRIAAIGARPTAFKTVRCDEVALQRYGITVEAFDNSDLLILAQRVDIATAEFMTRRAELVAYSDFSEVPSDRIDSLAKLSIALDLIIGKHNFNAIALRCWNDLQENLKISPCVLLGMLGNRGIPAACELDIGNAVAMYALGLASKEPATCLDWNNNYGDEQDKCILFHCGPVPKKMMCTPGKIVDHPMFAKAYGKGIGYGCNVGRIRPMDFTFTSFATWNGALHYYAGTGKFIDQELPKGYFGCGAVAEIPHLENMLTSIGKEGFRHHVSITAGKYKIALNEAFGNYLGFEKHELQYAVR